MSDHKSVQTSWRKCFCVICVTNPSIFFAFLVALSDQWIMSTNMYRWRSLHCNIAYLHLIIILFIEKVLASLHVSANLYGILNNNKKNNNIFHLHLQTLMEACAFGAEYLWMMLNIKLVSAYSKKSCLNASFRLHWRATNEKELYVLYVVFFIFGIPSAE